MISLEKMRSDLSKKLRIDQLLRSVEIHADTLDEALADAAVQLQSHISYIEFEVLEKGSDGLFGVGKKPWLIRAYENPSAVALRFDKKKTETEIVATKEVETLVVEDKDGEAFVHYFDSDIVLKVVPAQGKGKPASLDAVLSQIITGDGYSFDESLVKKLVKKSTNAQYEKIGKYPNIRENNAEATVNISSDEMSASIIALAPGRCGADISPEYLKTTLKRAGIVEGISDEKITFFVDNPIYDLPVTVVFATPAQNGRDAYIEYNFETDPSKIRAKETSAGQIDFKELNIIQNVVEKQELARKVPAEKGRLGRTVLGKSLEAKDGKDIGLPLGKNVVVAPDNLSILSTVNGQVLLIAGKITVEPIMEIAGDVSIKTGNINFLGTVIVKGNVDDGFSIKASGNVEVSGTVGNCQIEAEGDVVVSLGIMGRDEGYIKSGKSLWAKFIQNTKVEVEESIIVADGIINSDVTANKRIWVKGKRAAIIGGHLFATEEIAAKNIGSNSGGSETILEVGYNPQSKKRLDDLTAQQFELVKELEENGLNIQTLENTKKARKFLPPDKEESLQLLIKRRGDIMDASDVLSTEIQEIQTYLKELKIIGKISASGCVYPGVKLHIRDVREDIRVEITHVTFYLENGFVRQGKFEPPGEDTRQVPDGYSAS